MAHGWTDERRARQAELIRSWRPWTKSTGPKTEAGKAIASQNVVVGEQRRRAALAEARRELAAAVAKVATLTRSRREWWELL
ncbi:MAG TPA: hypothetical protein VMV91_09155 [Rhodocyclaceae bacterium]|nr:hypothetical protein [Rhodocyclaceae bacterium]